MPSTDKQTEPPTSSMGRGIKIIYTLRPVQKGLFCIMNENIWILNEI